MVRMWSFVEIVFVWSMAYLAEGCREYWDGTAPFCSGSCPRGWREIGRSNSGDGGYCWTGSKAHCQICDSTPDNGCKPTETETECWALVLMCKNIMRRAGPPETTETCNTYACGACLDIGSVGGSSNANLNYGRNTCKQGFVWREAGARDLVCVSAATRDQAKADNAAAPGRVSQTDHSYGPDTCVQGYVWREAFANDHVCVFPWVRTQVQQDNAAAESRYARNG